MKKTALFVSALMISILAMGASEKYDQKMGETLSGFSTCTSVEDYQDLANRFRIIANVEENEWLPLYYEAQCYILIGFMQGLSAEEKDAYLEKAASILDTMEKLAPGEAEIVVLEAFYLTGSLLVNPAQRSMGTSPMIYAALGRAKALEPNNPRAAFMEISNKMGTASYFGEDIEPYCAQARELLENWDSYQIKSPIHPSWGKVETEGIVSNCIN